MHAKHGEPELLMFDDLCAFMLTYVCGDAHGVWCCSKWNENEGCRRLHQAQRLASAMA